MYLIRDFKDTDLSSLELIFHDAVMAQGRRGYSNEQVEFWAAFPYLYAADFSSLVLTGYTRVMACYQIPVAFATLHPDDHLALLYVLGDHAGRGIAGRSCVPTSNKKRSFAAWRVCAPMPACSRVQYLNKEAIAWSPKSEWKKKISNLFVLLWKKRSTSAIALVSIKALPQNSGP